MTKFEKAAEFAAKYHAGQIRKLGGAPYIVHLYDTAAGAALVTHDDEILAAALLHDILEDTPVTADTLQQEFGETVARIVRWCSEDKMRGRAPAETWQERKVAAIERMKGAPVEAKIVLLADKVSNIRSIAAQYAKDGDAVWAAFNNSDKLAHEWAYRSYAEALADLEDEFLYKEYVRLVDEVFGAGFDL